MSRIRIIAAWLLAAWCFTCSAECNAQFNEQPNAKLAEQTTEKAISVQPGMAPIKTWAILGDKSAVASGLTDALLAELSTTDMQMVEREQLNQVIDEQTFQTLMSGLAAESRRLGSILHADALILVTHSPKPRLIICECRQGLRLGDLNIELKPVDEQAVLSANYIQDRRQQFAGGIRSIVGLAPLACRNIEHDYDHLQQRYFDMLTGRLMTIPGLALLEMQEARSIASEPGAGDQAADRLVPIMVECEYRVQVQRDVPLVRFKAQLTGRDVDTIESPELSVVDSGTWLGNDLVDQILKRGGGKPLKLPEQQTLLARRADYLMRLGDLAGAVQCREAYLLAEPSDVAQRTALVENLLTLGNQQATSNEPSPRGVRDRAAKLVTMAARWTPVVLDHLVYLIENRTIDQAVAIDLMERMNAIRFLQAPYVHVVQILKNDEDVRAGLDALLSANRRFVLRTAAKVLELAPSSGRTAEVKLIQLATWQGCVMRMVADDIAISAGDLSSFLYLEQVVLDKIPEELPTTWEVLNVITTYQRSFSALRLTNEDSTFQSIDIQIDEEAMQSWLQRLTSSRHIHLRWYGRTVKLLNRMVQDKVPAEMQSEFNQLVAEIKGRPLSHLRWNSGALLDAILQKLQFVQISGVPQDSASRIESSTPPLPANDVIAGKVVIQKLNMQFPENLASIKDFIKTDRGVDILVGEKVIGVIRKELAFVPIHQTSSRQASTAWDGEHLWIAEVGHGIVLYELDGRLAGKLTEKEGLPRHDVDLQILALQKNQILVYGCVGPDHRCWLGLVSVSKGVPQIKVIHEARQPYRPIANPKDPNVPLHNDDPTMGFQLMWWNAVSINDRRMCFVGRQVAPLAIDLQSEKVVSVQFERVGGNAWGTVLAGGGFLYKAYTTGVAQYDLPPDAVAPRFKRLIVDGGLPDSVPLWADYQPRLIEHDGWIYKTGKVWYRFRPDGSSLQRLISPEEPRPHQYEFTAESNYFGVVGWAPHGLAVLYQIKLPK